MTRINVVPVTELTQKHLIAEWKEISRIFTLARLPRPNEYWPKTYRMGTGHMKFLFDKLGWLTVRYEQLYLEMRRRKYNADKSIMIDVTKSAVERLPKELFGTFEVTEEALRVNRERLAKRLSMTYDYYVERYVND